VLGVAGEKNLAIGKANYLNAPKSSTRLRAAKKGFDTLGKREARWDTLL
jgi:hypothetical protein